MRFRLAVRYETADDEVARLVEALRALLGVESLEALDEWAVATADLLGAHRLALLSDDAAEPEPFSVAAFRDALQLELERVREAELADDDEVSY